MVTVPCEVLAVFAVCGVVTVPCEVLAVFAVCGVVTVPCEFFCVCARGFCSFLGVVTVPCEVLTVFAGTLSPWLLLLGACMLLLLFLVLV